MELKDKLNEKVFDEYYEYIKGIDRLTKKIDKHEKVFDEYYEYIKGIDRLTEKIDKQLEAAGKILSEEREATRVHTYILAVTLLGILIAIILK